MSKEARKLILDEAAKAVLHDRTTTHGGVEDNFATIAVYWTNHLQARGLLPAGKAMESRDVAVMLAMLKAARLAQSFDHRDNWVDMAGYAACGGGLVQPVQFNCPPLCSKCHTLHHVNGGCRAQALVEHIGPANPVHPAAYQKERVQGARGTVFGCKKCGNQFTSLGGCPTCACHEKPTPCPVCGFPGCRLCDPPKEKPA